MAILWLFVFRCYYLFSSQNFIFFEEISNVIICSNSFLSCSYISILSITCYFKQKGEFLYMVKIKRMKNLPACEISDKVRCLNIVIKYDRLTSDICTQVTCNRWIANLEILTAYFGSVIEYCGCVIVMNLLVYIRLVRNN